MRERKGRRKEQSPFFGQSCRWSSGGLTRIFLEVQVLESEMVTKHNNRGKEGISRAAGPNLGSILGNGQASLLERLRTTR